MTLVVPLASKPLRGRALPPPDLATLRHAAFPIFATTYADETLTRVLSEPGRQGTAFLLTAAGLFLTARHVVDAHDASAYSLLAYNWRTRARKLCGIEHLELHPQLDIAVGIAELPTANGFPHRFSLASRPMKIGSATVSFGYAKTDLEFRDVPGDAPALGFDFHPRAYEGRVDDYATDRISRVLGPCYLTSALTLGGISGGPFLRKRTMVVHGVLALGSVEEAERPYGVAVDVSAFLNDWRIPFLNNMTLREYANANPELLALR